MSALVSQTKQRHLSRMSEGYEGNVSKLIDRLRSGWRIIGALPGAMRYKTLRRSFDRRRGGTVHRDCGAPMHTWTAATPPALSLCALLTGQKYGKTPGAMIRISGRKRADDQVNDRKRERFSIFERLWQPRTTHPAKARPLRWRPKTFLGGCEPVSLVFGCLV